MKPDERVRALNAAAIQLDWLTDTEGSRHGTRYDAARLVLADTDTRATIASGSGGDGEGRRPKGEHSDPTGRTAVKHVDVAIDARTTARDLTWTVSVIADTARVIRSLLSGEPRTGPDTLKAARGDLAWCQTIRFSSPHVGNWTSDDPEEVRELNAACETVEEQSRILAGKVAVILRSAVRPPETKPEQKPLNPCRACGPWRKDTLAGPTGLCDQCKEFRYHHKCLPTEHIVRSWMAGRQARPGQILEAQAQRSIKRKRRSA